MTKNTTKPKIMFECTSTYAGAIQAFKRFANGSEVFDVIPVMIFCYGFFRPS